MSDDLSAIFDSAGPFGNSDGTREDFKRHFITFDGSPQIWGGLATKPNDLRARIIVGRKGSGKTLYLRTLEDNSMQRDDVYVFRQTNQLPPVETIVKFSSLFDDSNITSQWQTLWRRAIVLSLVSLFFAKRDRPQQLPASNIYDREMLYADFSQLVPEYITPQSIINQIGIIVDKYKNHHRMRTYLNDGRWESVEKIIFNEIRNAMPICYYIDAIDEDFRHAPGEWIDCQKGLFYQVMRLLRDNDAANRLHIVVCVRDIVYTSVLQSEHATRFPKSDEHIRLLNWEMEAAKKFLHDKVALLPREFISAEDRRAHGYSIQEWLGFNSVRNTIRKVSESVDDYMLRHTRLLPRDIINVGNEICMRIVKAKAKGEVLTPASFKEAVRETAWRIAKESIAICSNHIATASVANFGFRREIFDEMKISSIASDNIIDVVTSFIREIGADVFGYEALRKALNLYQEFIDVDGSVVQSKYQQFMIDTALWQTGLLGYREKCGRKRRSIFQFGSAESDFFLPKNRDEYIFHPSLIDYLGIRAVGRAPIGC